jgi:hypothetical protein
MTCPFLFYIIKRFNRINLYAFVYFFPRLNDIQKILKTEISSLKNEISHFWDTDEPALDYVQGNHPKLVKDILDARHMLNQKKKEVAKEASKR